MVIHEHCIRCYNSHCLFEPSNLEEGVSCKVVTCPSGCKISLHECKVTEHQSHICSAVEIPCINSLYGCPHRFARSKLISHLRHCPASVVTCKSEWNRWRRTPLANSDRVSMSSTLQPDSASDLLDVALTARDQRILGEALKMPRALRRSLRNSYTRNLPALPLTQRYSCVRFETDPMEESTDSLDFLTADEEESCEYHPPGVSVSTQAVHCSLCRVREEQSGLASSIANGLNHVKCEQEKKLEQKSMSSSDITNISSTEPTNKSQKVLEIDVDLIMEMFNSFRSKPTKLLTFLCAQDFRRDQFSQHYSTVHCDIQSGLDGWFQMRCPLSVYGCQFTQHRFITDTQNKVVFNPVTESFCITSKHESIEPVEGDSTNWFSHLSDEVLMLIFSNIDSHSIKNLSLTSKDMREKCSFLLRNHGMVILDWKKVEGAWITTEKVWSFSSTFDKPRRWVFADVNTIAEHIKSCPYNERQEYPSKAIPLHYIIDGNSVLEHLTPLIKTRIQSLVKSAGS